MSDPRPYQRPPQRDSATKLIEGLGAVERGLRQYTDASPSHQAEIAERRRGSEKVGQAVAAEKRAAVEREEAMLSELTATRQAVEAAEKRADAAEGREQEALDIARRNYRVPG